jgi:DNA-3-methyladenine glycosylase I
MTETPIVVGPDGQARCWWGTSTDDYMTYHDDEWGRPVTDDSRLYEKLVLEGFQSGLSWLTILRKRPAFRAAFADFNPEAVAEYDEHDVERLLGDAGIVRHRGKIEAAIKNAQAVVALQRSGQTLSRFVWGYAPANPERDERVEWKWAVPGLTATSKRLAKDLKSRGFVFIGPTTTYAFMQAMGLVNDHLPECHVYESVTTQQAKVRAKMGL